MVGGVVEQLTTVPGAKVRAEFALKVAEVAKAAPALLSLVKLHRRLCGPNKTPTSVFLK